MQCSGIAQQLSLAGKPCQADLVSVEFADRGLRGLAEADELIVPEPGRDAVVVAWRFRLAAADRTSTRPVGLIRGAA